MSDLRGKNTDVVLNSLIISVDNNKLLLLQDLSRLITKMILFQIRLDDSELYFYQHVS